MTEATPKRRRARKPDGQYKADNPATPENEAWESIPVEDALKLKTEAKYKVRQKVDGLSGATAGKYGKKGKVSQPGIGKARTISH